MRQYGGHYKVNGPPVNVPATLDQIIGILPCMPSELQLHPVKLKHKLEYKSHYMYDMMCRDHVICAITWLKQHNAHYRDITLNEHWYSDITSRLQNDIHTYSYDYQFDIALSAVYTIQQRVRQNLSTALNKLR